MDLDRTSNPLPIRPVKLEKVDVPGWSYNERDLKSDKYPLTLRQRVFINEYISGSTPQDAALAAGYSKNMSKQACDQILQIPKVKAEIKRRLNKTMLKADISANRVLEETARLAFSNILDYIEILPSGDFKINLANISRDQAVSIQELSHDVEGRVKLRLSDKKGALEMLAKLLKMFVDKVEVSGLDGQPLTIQTLDALIQRITVNNTQVNVYQQTAPNRLLPEEIIDAEEIK